MLEMKALAKVIKDLKTLGCELPSEALRSLHESDPLAVIDDQIQEMVTTGAMPSIELPMATKTKKKKNTPTGVIPSTTWDRQRKDLVK